MSSVPGAGRSVRAAASTLWHRPAARRRSRSRRRWPAGAATPRGQARCLGARESEAAGSRSHRHPTEWRARPPRRDSTRRAFRRRWRGASSPCSRRSRARQRSPCLSAPRRRDGGSRAAADSTSMPCETETQGAGRGRVSIGSGGGCCALVRKGGRAAPQFTGERLPVLPAHPIRPPLGSPGASGPRTRGGSDGAVASSKQQEEKTCGNSFSRHSSR